MRVEVRVVPGARRRGVERESDGTLTVRVSQPPEDGRANAAVRVALAEYFRVPHSAVRIVRGATSRRKLIDVTRPA